MIRGIPVFDPVSTIPWGQPPETLARALLRNRLRPTEGRKSGYNESLEERLYHHGSDDGRDYVK